MLDNEEICNIQIGFRFVRFKLGDIVHSLDKYLENRKVTLFLGIGNGGRRKQEITIEAKTGLFVFCANKKGTAGVPVNVARRDTTPIYLSLWDGHIPWAI